jgi:hypothetical protein
MVRSDDDTGGGSRPSAGRGAWKLALWSALAFSVAGLAGCDDGPKPTPAVDADPGPQWWQPQVGQAKNWDIQLAAPIDVSAPRVMYDLDLWSLVPVATTIDYGDGKPVMVSAGSLAGTIAQLHARTPSTIVICHLETGILDLTLPDAPKFPGYHASSAMIPDQTPPEAGSVIGWHVGTSTKRWLDISAANRAKWIEIMFKRFDLARQIGCDGVEPDRNQATEFPGFTGFAIPPEDSFSWYAEIAKRGHDRKLSTGMKNSYTQTTDTEAAEFDWQMVERCGEEGNCDATRPFINLQKAVFAIDYDHAASCPDPPSPPCPPLPSQASSKVCAQQTKEMIADGIIKDSGPNFNDLGLTSKVRMQCVP